MADEAKPAVAPAKAEEPKAKAAAKITPTPTQDELNQLVEGKFPELANDGSGPDPNEARNSVRHIGAKPAGEYSTRSMSSKS